MEAGLINRSENGITYYNISKAGNEEQCELISSKCTWASRWEKVKAGGFAALAIGLSTAMVFLALSIAKFAAILMALIALPLAPILPLYGILVLSAALAAGGAAGYFGVKNIWNFFFDQAKTHWERAGNYSHQADLADCKKAEIHKG